MKELFQQWIKDPVISKMMILLIGGAVLWASLLFIRKRIVSKIGDNATRYHSRKAVTYIGYFLTIIFIIVLFSNRLGNIGIALGVAGAGIAFALQEVFASIAGWLALSFGGFFRVGDRVQLGGIKGDVIDIGVLRTTVMELGQWVDGDLYNGRIVRIANSFVFKEPVFNYSADFPFLWDEIKIPIQYGSDYRLTKAMLQRVATDVVGRHSEMAAETWKKMVRKYMIEDASTDPMISMVANDNWVEFTLRYVVNYKLRRTTKNKLFESILDDMEQSGGKIKMASATFHLVEAPEFNVKVR
ncbi:MAG: mechanosensitive ion channel [Terrimonas sp.]|nr:mechanosensitive ion channel [Terrimonas sp.]